jgi:hypothetical protein
VTFGLAVQCPSQLQYLRLLTTMENIQNIETLINKPSSNMFAALRSGSRRIGHQHD